MEKFMNWLQFSLAPAVQRFTTRPWIGAFSSAIVKCLPFILTGSLIYFYNALMVFAPWLPSLSAVTDYTFSMLALLVAFMMVYQAMQYLKHREYQVVGGLTGICCYMMSMGGETVDGVYSVTWNRFGPTGMIVALIVGIYVAVIFNLIAKLKLFENNTTVPEFLQEWIRNIIPIFLSVFVLKFIVLDFGVDLFPIVTSVFTPIQAIAQSYPGFLFMNLFITLFYSIGISGWVFSGPRQAIFIPAMAANVAAVAAGGIATNITTSETCSTIALINLGGIGCTLALNLLMLRSKSKRLRSLGKVCLAPSIFNINEPLLYGIPMVFNPLLMIPMWLCVFAGSTLVYAIMSFGLLNIPSIQLSMVGTLPAPWSTVVFCDDWRGIIWWAVCLVLYLAIYYPFFKAYERQVLAEEAEQEAALGSEDAPSKLVDVEAAKAVAGAATSDEALVDAGADADARPALA